MIKINIRGLLIPVITLLVLIILIFILSDTPIRTIYFFFFGPFRTIFSFGNMLNAAVPLIFGALGIIIAKRAGNLNLGGEGQIYLGAFAALAAALVFNQFGIIGGIIAAITGAASAGVLAGISGFCKSKWKTNELITTFLLSCAIIPVINYCVTGSFLDPETSLISTKKIALNMRLPLILNPSNLNLGIIFAVIFVFVVHYFLNKTKMGYELRMAGHNEMFARFGGINTGINTILALGLSGFLYGLAGSILVLGTHYAVIKDFTTGLGWSGLTVALIANFSPVSVIPCALFLAWINSGARIAMQNTGLTYEITFIIQALLFLLAARKGWNN
jgi:simple sugar transport system permease protein